MKSILPNKINSIDSVGVQGEPALYDEGFDHAIDLCEEVLRNAVTTACDVEKLLYINRLLQNDDGEIVISFKDYNKHLNRLVDMIIKHIRGCFYKEEAEKLLERMVKEGIIGPYQSGKDRDVLMGDIYKEEK